MSEFVQITMLDTKTNKRHSAGRKYRDIHDYIDKNYEMKANGRYMVSVYTGKHQLNLALRFYIDHIPYWF